MLTVGLFLVLYVVVSTGVPVYYHLQEHGVVNWIQVCLAFFLPLNSLICIWEISLSVYIKQIRADYLKMLKVWKGREFDCVIDFFCSPMSMSELFTLSYWGRVWSTYSLYDPSYSNKESFGFFVDCSNGWSFLFPSLFFLYCMTYDYALFLDSPITPRTLGLIGLVPFYVEFHGTIVYFSSYLANQRYKNFTLAEVVLFIGGSNGLWIIFPVIGMYACYDMIQTDSMAILRT